MKIHFESSGGLEGIIIDTVIDSESLPSEESSMLEQLVSGSNFFELPSFVKTPTNGADYFIYKITIRMDGKEHSIERNDLNMESTLGPLIEYLRNRAA